MNYAVILYQQGGCDYTIECGTKIHYLGADTREEAEKEAKRLVFKPLRTGTALDENSDDYEEEDLGRYTEANISSMQLIEITYSKPLPLAEWRVEYSKAKTTAHEEAEKAKRLAQFNKLKKEFGEE